jgi:cellobiose-specific phosphotransferase system component IIC
VAALIAYLAYVFTALVGWVVFVPGNPREALPFALHTALDWPAFVIAIASLIVSLAFFAYLPWRTRNLM